MHRIASVLSQKSKVNRTFRILRNGRIIQFLTDPGDIVLDMFSGSNTTGYVAEQLQRQWLTMELDPNYAALSAVGFMDGWPESRIRSWMTKIEDGTLMRFPASPVGLFDEQSANPKPRVIDTDAPNRAMLWDRS